MPAARRGRQAPRLHRTHVQPDAAHGHVDGPAPDAQELGPQGQCGQKALLATSTRGLVGVSQAEYAVEFGIFLSQEGASTSQLHQDLLCSGAFWVFLFVCFCIEAKTSSKFC